MKSLLIATAGLAIVLAYACSRESKADDAHDLTCAPISAGTLSSDVHRCENDEVVCYARGDNGWSCFKK